VSYSPVTFVFFILESSHQIDSRHKDAGRIPQHSGKLSAGHRPTIRCKFDIRVQLDLLIETAGTMLLDGCRMRSDKPHSRTPIIVRFWRTSSQSSRVSLSYPGGFHRRATSFAPCLCWGLATVPPTSNLLCGRCSSRRWSSVHLNGIERRSYQALHSRTFQCGRAPFFQVSAKERQRLVQGYGW
jgi:hypothetical protein